jgi:cytochrome c oxidase subunit 2
MHHSKLIRGMTASFVALTAAGTARAQEVLGDLEIVGAPIDRGIGFQPAGFVLVIITIISLFVTALLAYACYAFHEQRNKTPATFTHNSPLEVTWTVVPILILVLIGSFSLPVLFNQQEIPEGDIVIKATGYQWYWGYEYPEEGLAFDSIMLQRDELEEYGYSQREYLLATDTAIVVPTGATIVMQVTGADVIHAWTIPSFGVKQDAVPGRSAELWFEAEREGIYFGQCSELCGKDHAYMPITVKVVSPEVYENWLVEAKEEFAGVPRSIDVASAD